MPWPDCWRTGSTHKNAQAVADPEASYTSWQLRPWDTPFHTQMPNGSNCMVTCNHASAGGSLASLCLIKSGPVFHKCGIYSLFGSDMDLLILGLPPNPLCFSQAFREGEGWSALGLFLSSSLYLHLKVGHEVLYCTGLWFALYILIYLMGARGQDPVGDRQAERRLPSALASEVPPNKTNAWTNKTNKTSKFWVRNISYPVD